MYKINYKHKYMTTVWDFAMQIDKRYKRVQKEAKHSVSKRTVIEIKHSMNCMIDLVIK
jgi:hypothetical protein